MTADTLMWQGAHKGKLLKEIPANYLNWLAGQIREKSKLHWSLTEKKFIKWMESNSTT